MRKLKIFGNFYEEGKKLSVEEEKLDPESGKTTIKIKGVLNDDMAKTLLLNNIINKNDYEAWLNSCTSNSSNCMSDIFSCQLDSCHDELQKNMLQKNIKKICQSDIPDGDLLIEDIINAIMKKCNKPIKEVKERCQQWIVDRILVKDNKNLFHRRITSNSEKEKQRIKLLDSMPRMFSEKDIRQAAHDNDLYCNGIDRWLCKQIKKGTIERVGDKIYLKK